MLARLAILMALSALASAATVGVSAAQSAEPLNWEAEALEPQGAEPETKYSGGASGGAYVFLPNAQKDPAAPPKSQLMLPEFSEPGAWRIRLRLYADGGSGDSVFVVAGSQSKSLGIRPWGEWVWQETEIALFGEPPYRISIIPREKARIDMVEAIRVSSGAPILPIRQSEPVSAEPNGSRPLDINPPTFRWPGNWELPYEIELKKAGEDWSQAERIGDIKATYYRPLDPLAPGEYAWRVRRQGAEAWGAAARFIVEPETARWPIEPWDSVFARLPKARPRIFSSPADLDRLRAEAQTVRKDLFAELARNFEKQIGAPLALESDKPVADVSNRQESTIRRVASKADAGKTMGPVSILALLGRALDREDFAQEAIRRAMAATRLDPQGYTSHSVSDFANSSILSHSAFVYDWLYDQLSPDQRQAIRAMLLARMDHYKPGLEQSIFSAHGWQHVIHDHAAAALALWDEEPFAREWLEWAAQMFVAHYPWYGGADGGSAECASYYLGTNLASSFATPLFWQRACGLDLLGNPWFRENTWFMMYSVPLAGPRSNFGDFSDGQARPDAKVAYFARMMADRYGNPFAAAYSEAALEQLGRPGPESAMSSIQALHSWLARDPAASVAPQPLENLPAGRAFRDVGMVFLHSDFASSSNAMLEFKSSPYGNSGHAHGDQNSFNLAAFGEWLIIDSGYYTSYGDEHHYGWTVTTKAHNTLLVDGEGQPREPGPHGRIAGFEQGDGWAWIAGDATKAYLKPRLERFIRQIVWLKGDETQAYVIHDSIAGADGGAHRFDWLLHMPAKPDLDAEEQTAIVRTESAEGRIAWLAPVALQFQLSDRFDPPAVVWREDKQAKLKVADQWHLTATPAKAENSQTFLTVILAGKRGAGQWPAVEAIADGAGARIGSAEIVFDEAGASIARDGKAIRLEIEAER
ncbi:MAG: Heparinase II/III-like protein [candidate division BRC1 bacterium ADurb.BinA364]|nr:MAG: Heparinase II/III-like protein [candidate division BRC1 bacterium ADurb.BinA364]